MKSELKVTHVKSYRTPDYPTKEDVIRNPDILRIIPKRWRKNPAICAVLIFTLSTGLFACAKNEDGENTQDDDAMSAITIPVFEHGSGRGSFGCVSVAPPVFLSEEEACQVIREEAERAGIAFHDSKTVYADLAMYDSAGGENSNTKKTVKREISLDGYNADLRIGFEYVSLDDFRALSKPKNNDGPQSSVEAFNMKFTADELSANIPGLAAFYDPGSDFHDFNFDWSTEDENAYSEYLEKYTADQKEKMKEQLREQVRDFLEWLAGEGVI